MANTNTVINVVVARKNPTIVTSNGVGGALNTSEPVTLKTSTTIIPVLDGGGGVDTLVELLDVAANGSPANGSTLVYSAANNTFVVEPLPFPDLTNLDCGTF